MKGYFLSFPKALRLFIALSLLFAPLLSVQAQCPVNDITVNLTDVTCNGFDDGTLEIVLNNPNGYTGTYNYIIVGIPLSGDAVIQNQIVNTPSVTFTNLPAADYSIFVTFPTDPSCTGFSDPGPFQIFQPTPLIAGLDNVTPACSPGTGAIDISVSGGNGNYSYAWSGPTNPGNVEDPVNLDAGDYSVTITDDKGCTVDIIDIFVPIITAADAGPDQVVCDNNAVLAGNAYRNPGEIGSWSVISGTGTFADPNDPNSAVSGLSEGDNVFEWFITDDGGICPGTTDQVTVTWYNLQLTSPGDIVLNCNAVADGAGTFSVTGGNGPFNFTVDQNTAGATITPNASSLDFSGAGPGIIEITVTDADGCAQSQLITLTEPPALVIDSFSSTDATCNSGNDGTITVVASGGTGALVYTLQPGGIANGTGAFAGLSAGDYTVEVSDANACGPVSTATITIAEPTAISIDNVVSTNVTCNSGMDGSVTVVATGGTAPLTYTLQPLGISNATGIFPGLAAGVYTVDVDDATACGPVTTAPINITEPALPVIDNITATDVTCATSTDGTITVAVSGGVTPYTFTLNPGAVSNNTGVFNNLAPGTYNIDITEANGCGPITTGDIAIGAPPAIVIDNTNFSDPLCNGAADGTITVAASGGTGTITYTIQPAGVSNTTGVFDNLVAGDYTVEVTDDNGCGPEVTGTITLTDPAAIVIDNVATIDATCGGGNDGSITVTASGGTGTLTYTLNPGAVSNNTGIFSNLVSGTYTVDITDDNACGPVTTADLIIGEPSLNLAVTNPTICDPAQGDVVITVSGTTAGITYELQTQAGASLTPAVTAVSTGGDLDLIILQANAPVVTTIYRVVAQVVGCGEIINANEPVVTVSPQPDINLAVSDAVSCNPASDPITITIAASENGVTYELQDLGGNPLTPPVTVAGNGGNADLIIAAAQAPNVNTTYQIAAVNAAGCSSILTDQPTVSVSDAPTALFQGDVTACEGSSSDLGVDLTGIGPWDLTYSDGVTETTVNVGASPYIFQVSPSVTTTYDLVRVTDLGTGCTTDPLGSSATVTVQPITGDEVSFGSGDWIGYVYEDGPTGPPYPGRVDFDPAKYRGFINQPENFDLNLGNNLTPLTGPDLCGAYDDNFSIRFKLRKDFAPGTYQITVGGDDGFRLSLDGGATFIIDEFVLQTYTTRTINICLDGSTDLVLEYFESGGSARVSFNATLLSPANDVSVTIAADQLPACIGTPTTFTATPVDAGTNPTYQWQVNGVSVPGATSSDFTTTLLNDGDIVRAIVTADPTITCVINNPATSNEITYNSTDALTADVTISADQNPVCIGTDVTFTAVTTNAGALPTYQWQVNGVDVPGETAETFTSSSLNDGDLVRVTIATDPALTCVTNITAQSNEIAISIVSDLTATASIISSANPACIGEDVIFQSTVTDAGANPTYQWQINGVDVAGAIAPTFTSNSLNDGDVVRLIVTADPSATCVNNSPVTSNEITQQVQPGTPMTVTVTADNTSICSGEDVTFEAVVTDGGANPTYQWQLNGLDISAATNSTYIATGLLNGDQITVVVTADPSAGCVPNSPFTSNPITILVQDAITPVADITVDQNPVCIGDVATFTVNITDAGTAPTIQWQVNGADVAGETGATFTSAGLNDGDLIRAVVTADPSLICATVTTVTTNEIALSTVSDLTASVTIDADQDPVCVGDAVTFTATAQNAGANPTFQWQVNGADIAGETNVTFTSSTLADGDLVTVELTADPAASCVNNPVITSLQYTINVVNSLNPSVSVVANNTTICAGNPVQFTATTTEAGLNPTYQWQINGAPVAGANAAVFTSNTLVDGDQVNVIINPDPAATCAPAGPVSSNVVNISVRPAGDPACTGGAGCGAFIVQVTPVRPPCNLPDEGSLSFLITGGSGSYTVVLSGSNGFNQGEIGASGIPILFEDLSADDYQYTITDTNGNTCTLPFTLENETILEAAVIDVVDSECFNEPDGQATIEILSGGNAPYEYSLDGILWNQALTSVFTVTNLSAADSPIGILIRDDASDVCPEEVFVTINNLYPEIVTPVASTPVTTCDGDEGSITVTYPPMGGNSPNNIWQISVVPGNGPVGDFKPFTAEEVVTDLTAGAYSVFIQDEGGCIKRIPVTVGSPNQVDLVANVVSADCSNDGRSGGLQIQVNNTIEVPGPYRLTIEALNGAQAGQVIYEDLTYNGGYIEFDTLISATYLIVVIPTDASLCPVELERTITGGPQPVAFDFQLTCSGGTNLKQLLLTDIEGDPNSPFTLRVFDNLSSQLVEEITFNLNIGNQYLIENYFFLTSNKEYKLRLVQSPSICAGQEIRYDHPENLLIPSQLMARIGETTKSLPDRATGTLQVIDFVGGYQPVDNDFPYLIAIELDSAAVPGQSFSTDFDTVRINSNLDFEKLYEDIPAGRYRVFITDQQGCSIELVARVPLDTDIFIPNIFTPNGDGDNQTFFIRNKPDGDVKLIITNRWGKRVFSADNYQNNWDGGDLPDGVYFYHIMADGEEYKGWVEILRNIAP